MDQSNVYIREGLSEDTGDFWVDHEVPVLNDPSPVTFLRAAISRYHPVIIRGAIDHWPALKKWNREYLTSVAGNEPVSINLTPDGEGDCVKSKINRPVGCDVVATESGSQRLFVYPAEYDMPLKDFFDLLEDKRDGNVVPYLSQQNDNLRLSFPGLLNDIDASIALAADAFGESKPEAVNLWIGDERSVSAIHKDHFENLYAVVSGEKTFTLLPPTDTAFLPENVYETARYTVKKPSSPHHKNPLSDIELDLTREGCPAETLSWIPLDPDVPSSVAEYPAFQRYAHPVRCTVKAGEVLYIPAMWYHRVSQTKLTIAVNYWYDQQFDFRYVFYQSIRRMAESKTSEATGNKSNSGIAM